MLDKQQAHVPACFHVLGSFRWFQVFGVVAQNTLGGTAARCVPVHVARRGFEAGLAACIGAASRIDSTYGILFWVSAAACESLVADLEYQAIEWPTVCVPDCCWSTFYRVPSECLSAQKHYTCIPAVHPY
jgi:hypothetical protein